jgi:hypothetical protein
MRRSPPCFMIVEAICELEAQLGEVSIEAKGIALDLTVRTFCRGRRFVDDEAIAHAIGIQPRRLARVKGEFPEFFELVDSIVDRALERYQCREKPKKNPRSPPKTPSKINVRCREGLDLQSRPRAPATPPPLAGCASPPAQSCHFPQHHVPPSPRHQAETPGSDPARPLPEGWEPSDDDLVYVYERGQRNEWIGQLWLAFCQHHRRQETLSNDWSAEWRRRVDQRLATG